MKNSSAIAFLWLAVLPLPQAFLQAGDPWTHPRFSHYSLEQGLSNATVFDILMDRRGYLWFATKDGLNKFDGYRFTVYRHDTNDPDSLSANMLAKLLEDSRGELWVCTMGGGVSRFDRKTERFTAVNSCTQPLRLRRDGVLAIAEDAEGYVWVSLQGAGLDRFSPDRARVDPFTHDPDDPGSLPDDWIYALYRDRAGNLWAGGHTGLAMWDPTRQKFLRFTPDPPGAGANSDRRVWAIYEDQRGALWVGVGARLAWLDRQTGAFHWTDYGGGPPAGGQAPEIRAIQEDREGALWVATLGSGLFRLAPDRQSWRSVVPRADDAHSLYNKNILALCVAPSGVIWIGMEGSGLNKLTPVARRFGRRLVSGAFPLEAEPQTLALAEDQRKNLWVGASQGLFLFDAAGAPLAQFREETFPGKKIMAVCEDSAGDVWAGAFHDGLYRFSYDADGTPRVARQFLHDPADPASLGHNEMSALLADRTGALWVGSAYAGLHRYDRDLDRFDRFRFDRDQPTSLSGDYITALYQDRRGDLWVGTYHGLNRMPLERPGVFTRYVHDPANPHSLSRDPIRAILEDRAERVWIGVEGGGLNLWNPDNGQFQRFSTRDGMQGDTVYGMLEDDSGYLWLSVNGGLTRFNPDRETFDNFNLHHGLQSNEFSFGASAKGRDGALYFGGTRGFNGFNPERIVIDQRAPDVVLTDFRLNRQSAKAGLPHSPLSHALDATERIELTHERNVFSFEFAGLHYDHPQDLAYAYMLERFDENWIETDADQRLASYTNLDPGSYRFWVKAKSPGGDWSPPVSVELAILPPPWRTWQAYVLYGLIFFSLLWLYLRFQRQKLTTERAAKQTLERKVAERTLALETKNREILAQQRQLADQAASLARQTERLADLNKRQKRFFTNISHEFRTPLSLTLGPLDDLAAGAIDRFSRQDLAIMRRNAHRLEKLIDELLDLAKLDAGQMTLDKRTENLAELLRQWAGSYQSLADRRQIVLAIQGAETPFWLAFDRNKLEKAIHNLLFNAFKFTGEGGKIMVKLERAEGGWARIAVKDTGSGIADDQLPHVFDRFYQGASGSNLGVSGGVGLSLAKEIVALHGGVIKAASEPGFGSEFTVELPRGQVDLKTINAAPTEPADPEPAAAESRPLLLDGPEGAPPDPEPQADERAPTLLIVEDHQDVRAYLASRLRREYRLLEAADGDTGLAIARDLIPDLIISDVMMPGLDGRELCRRLKKDERTSHIPIILLTAKASAESEIAGLETGADDYLVKPFHAGVLRRRIGNLIENRRKLRERFSRETVLTPKDIAKPSADQVFLQKIHDLLEARHADSQFGVSELALEIGFSRRQLHRKLSALTNHTPIELIRRFRLERAAQLLRENAGNISEIAFMVGFNKPRAFSAYFREVFGMSPSEFIADAEAS